MKLLVYLDDNPESYASFYRAMEMVKDNDWVILVSKVNYSGGRGHDVKESIKWFSRVMDQRHIKNLHFMERGLTRDILKEKAKQFGADILLICPYNRKIRKLCDFVSDNLTCNLMVVREFVPRESALIPPKESMDVTVPRKKLGGMKISESCSSIPTSTSYISSHRKLNDSSSSIDEEEEEYEQDYNNNNNNYKPKRHMAKSQSSITFTTPTHMRHNQFETIEEHPISSPSSPTKNKAPLKPILKTSSSSVPTNSPTLSNYETSSNGSPTVLKSGRLRKSKVEFEPKTHLVG